jgi:hypothetical protein
LRVGEGVVGDYEGDRQDRIRMEISYLGIVQKDYIKKGTLTTVGEDGEAEGTLLGENDGDDVGDPLGLMDGAFVGLLVDRYQNMRYMMSTFVFKVFTTSTTTRRKLTCVGLFVGAGVGEIVGDDDGDWDSESEKSSADSIAEFVAKKPQRQQFNITYS